jgi:hypothetical protein
MDTTDTTFGNSRKRVEGEEEIEGSETQEADTTRFSGNKDSETVESSIRAPEESKPGSIVGERPGSSGTMESYVIGVQFGEGIGESSTSDLAAQITVAEKHNDSQHVEFE